MLFGIFVYYVTSYERRFLRILHFRSVKRKKNTGNIGIQVINLRNDIPSATELCKVTQISI